MDPSTPWRIDDEDLARALAARGLPCIPLQPDDLAILGPDDVVFLGIASPAWGARSTDHGGALVLEELAAPAPGFPTILLYGVEPFEHLLRHSRTQAVLARLHRATGLPPETLYLEAPEALLDPDALARRVHTLRASWTDEQRRAYHVAARDHAVEALCSRLRHALAPVRRCAARIALGAAVTGEIPWHAACGLLDALSHPDDAVDAADVDLLAGYLAMSPPAPDRPACALPPGVPSEGVVLLVDDDDETRAAWSGVLTALFGSWWDRGLLPRRLRLVTASSAAEARALLDLEDGAPRPPPELVLADYSLGAGDSGGTLLQRLKAASLAVPVVMFTSHDSATLTQWCLAHGASGYFVKETSTRAGRTSAGHYRVLRDLVLGLVGRDAAWHSTARPRLCWERYARLEPAVLALEAEVARAIASARDLGPADRAELPSLRPSWPLSNALRFLLEAREGGSPQSTRWAVAESHNACDLLFWCEAAVSRPGELATAPWRERRRSRYDLLEPRSRALFDRDIHERVHRYERVTHPNTHALPEDADLSVVESALDFYETYLDRRSPGARTAPLRRAALEQGAAPDPPPAGPIRSHPEVAELGAEDFRRGAAEWHERHPTRVKKLRSLLFLEDEPHRGWAAALRTFEPLGWKVDVGIPVDGASGWQVDLLAPRDGRAGEPRPLDRTLVGQYDLVLQDLCLPTEAAGLRLVEHLRRCDACVPVVVLTAADDSALLVPATRAGASDWFLKSRGSGAPAEAFEALRHLLDAWMERFGRTSVLRGLASRIHRVAARANDLSSSFRGDPGGPVPSGMLPPGLVGEQQALAQRLGCAPAHPASLGPQLPSRLREMLDAAWSLLALQRRPTARPGGWIAEGCQPPGRRVSATDREMVAIECGRALETCREAMLVMPALRSRMADLHGQAVSADDLRPGFRSFAKWTEPWASLPWGDFDRVFNARHKAAHGELGAAFDPEATVTSAVDFVEALLRLASTPRVHRIEAGRPRA